MGLRLGKRGSVAAPSGGRSRKHQGASAVSEASGPLGMRRRVVKSWQSGWAGNGNRTIDRHVPPLVPEAVDGQGGW